MRTLFSTLLLFVFSGLSAAAQELVVEADTVPVKEYTPEELAQIREKRIEEMLPNTRALVFIDSLVVNKDEFLQHLKMTSEIGQFVEPNQLVSAERLNAETGHAAFVNSLQNSAFFSVADTLGNLRICNTFRNAGQWTDPRSIEELRNFDYQDYPFLCTDGSTLYFCASGIESIGGLDLFVTRYNEETRQYVRPQNLGFPYNSTANDYLLAIDEENGIGVLVSDRRQPDDKVCIYWFIAEARRNIYDYDPEDAEAEAIVRDFAAIARIADTQEDQEEAIKASRSRWEAALKAQAEKKKAQHRFLINDTTIYTSLDDFHNESARSLAEQWLEATKELKEMEGRQKELRNAFAASRNEDLKAALLELETLLPQKRALVHSLEKQFRVAEKQ